MCLFIVSFIYMDDKRLLPDTLVLITIAVSVVGYIVSKLVDKFTTVDSSDDKNQRTGKKCIHYMWVLNKTKAESYLWFRKQTFTGKSQEILYGKFVFWVTLH